MGAEHSAAGAKADRVEVDKWRQTVKVFDRSNALIGFYPATVGSEEKPSPTGTLKVTEIDHNPTYRYHPDYRFFRFGPELSNVADAHIRNPRKEINDPARP